MAAKLMEWRQEIEDANEFVDGMKSEVFQDRVYVLLPAAISLICRLARPPIDFAYHVHTRLATAAAAQKSTVNW
jgi:GTP pyrophosphokinase